MKVSFWKVRPSERLNGPLRELLCCYTNDWMQISNSFPPTMLISAWNAWGVFLYNWGINSSNELDFMWNLQLSPSDLCVVRAIKLWWSGHLETQRITTQRYCCVCFTEALNDPTILKKETLFITTERSPSQCTKAVLLDIKLMQWGKSEVCVGN